MYYVDELILMGVLLQTCKTSETVFRCRSTAAGLRTYRLLASYRDQVAVSSQLCTYIGGSINAQRRLYASLKESKAGLSYDNFYNNRRLHSILLVIVECLLGSALDSPKHGWLDVDVVFGQVVFFDSVSTCEYAFKDTINNSILKMFARQIVMI